MVEQGEWSPEIAIRTRVVEEVRDADDRRIDGAGDGGPGGRGELVVQRLPLEDLGCPGYGLDLSPSRPVQWQWKEGDLVLGERLVDKGVDRMELPRQR